MSGFLSRLPTGRLIACGEGSTRMGFGSWPTLSAKEWMISGHVLK